MSAGVRQLKPDFPSDSIKRTASKDAEAGIFLKGRRLRRCPGEMKKSPVGDRFGKRAGQRGGEKRAQTR